MPGELLDEPLDKDIEDQLDKFQDSGLFRGTLVQLPLFRALLAKSTINRFKTGESGEKIVTDIYQRLGRKLDDPGGAAKHVIETGLRPRLEKYYSDHPDDPVIISIPARTFRPDVKRRDNPSEPKAELGVHDEGLLAYVGKWHSYHLTRNAKQNFWSYKTLVFEFERSSNRAASPARLVATAATLDIGMPDKAKEDHSYRSELSLFGGQHILIQTIRLKGIPDIAVEVFRDVGPPRAESTVLYGMKTITHSWENLPLMTISIMSRTELACTRSVKDGWPKDGHAIVNEKIMAALENEWNNWQLRPNVERLGTGIISDHQFLQMVKRVPDTASRDIWVAAHNLQNVGDTNAQSSILVRQSLTENASRGITYSYICPKQEPGKGRINLLEDCFKKHPNRLTLHVVPDAKFAGIMLLLSHFVILNPTQKELDAYMQLPLPTAQKGWIKLDNESAHQVRNAMRRLMKEYPDSRRAIVNKVTNAVSDKSRKRPAR